MDDREKREQGEVFSAPTQLKKKHKDKKPGSRRWITLVILIAVVGLAVGGYYLSAIIVPAVPEATPAPSTAPSSYLLVDKDKADFVSAHIKTASEDYSIIRQGDGYGIKDLSLFSLDQSKANNLVTSCTYLYVNDIADSAGNLADYGLDNPTATVTAAYADGSSLTFLLGSIAPSGYRYYMKVENDPKIYTVFSSTGERFTATLQSLHIMPTLSVASDGIRNVHLTRANGTVFEVGYSDEASLGISGVRVKQPFSYEADSEKLTTLFENIAAITLNAFEVDAVEETLSLYGLDAPRYALSVTGLGTDATGASVEDATLMTLWVGNDKSTELTYVRIDESSKVYTISRSALTFLGGITAADMVDRFANIINIQKVESIEVISDGLNVVLDITRTPELDESGNQATNANGQPKYIEDFTLNGEFCDDSTFRKLYQIIIGTRVDGVIPEGKQPAEDVEAVVTVRYRLNEIRDEEIIEYVPYDASHYAVRRNGVCLFYIDKTRVSQITNALNDVAEGTFVPANYGV